MAERDSGWIQLYTVDAQESYDTVLQAFRIAEHHQVLLPTMVMMDGFIVSHTLQNVHLIPDDAAAKFVGPERVVPNIKVPYLGEVPLALNTAKPITIGPLDLWDYYFEHKMQQEEAINRAKEVIGQVSKEYGDLTGRHYGDGLIEEYAMDGAERVVVCMSSTYGTAKTVVRDLRAKGENVGLLRIRCYRPFPAEELQAILQNVEGVAVLDRCLSPGAQGGPLFNEIRSIFYGSDGPKIIGYTYGLGGRDMPPELIRRAYTELEQKPCGYRGYLGVRG